MHQKKAADIDRKLMDFLLTDMQEKINLMLCQGVPF